MSTVRIECPKCGTSFRSDTLRLKTSPGEKALVQCMCGGWLEVEFHEKEVFQKRWLGLRKDLVAKERHAKVTLDERVDVDVA